MTKSQNWIIPHLGPFSESRSHIMIPVFAISAPKLNSYLKPIGIVSFNSFVGKIAT